MPYLWGFVFFLFLLGFPFLILVVANKQDGWLKIAGWILAGVFVLMLVLSSLFSLAMGMRGMMCHPEMCPGDCHPSMNNHPGCPCTPEDGFGFKIMPRRRGMIDGQEMDAWRCHPEQIEGCFRFSPELRERMESSFYEGVPGEKPTTIPPGIPSISPEDLIPPARP